MPDLEIPTASARADGLAIVRWLLIVAVAFGVLAAGLRWVSKPAADASPDPVAIAGDDPADGGDPAYPAPDFRLASLQGEHIGPPDFRGKVVLVEFWATWCSPCRVQARFLEQLHRELEGEVQFLAIDVGEDEDTVREYAAETPFPYPVLLDPEDTLGPRYRIYGLPTVMIVDRQGAVSFLRTGISDLPTLRRALAASGAEI